MLVLGEVEAVFGQRGERGDCEEENYYSRRASADTDGVIAESTTRSPAMIGQFVAARCPRGSARQLSENPNILTVKRPVARHFTIIRSM